MANAASKKHNADAPLPKKFKKGDKVVVLSGREKGKKGEILRMLTKTQRVVIGGVNMVKRHTRPTPMNPGGRVEKEASLHISNIAHVDPKTGQATRVGFKVLENGKKVRFAKKSGEVIDQ